VARYFVGLTPGYVNPGHSAEDIRDNLDQIRDETGYIVGTSNNDELRKLFKLLK
jgi:hypothetical protein